MSKTSSTLLRARVDTDRYREAEQVFKQIGLKTSDAINVFLAQVALRKDLPFVVTTEPGRLISDEEQAYAWDKEFGEY